MAVEPDKDRLQALNRALDQIPLFLQFRYRFPYLICFHVVTTFLSGSS
jgi:hypothetical protein